MSKRITTSLILSIFLITNFLLTNHALAQEFNPNFVLSDNDLTDHTSMSMTEIQDFLKNKGSFLATYVEPVVRMLPSQIIYDMAWTHKINPKYILVLLQKEQSLITDADPVQGQLDWATGYGCPDGGGCNDKYKGLHNQIDWGAGGTRFYFDNPDKFKYQVGETYNIDGESVTIANDATRSLYIYTPHTHGNQSLFNIWQDWFSLNYPDGSLVQNIEDGGIWLIQNGKRRPITSMSVFLSLYSLDKVVLIEQSNLEKYPKGIGVLYPNYSLLRIETGGVYLNVDDHLRPIQSKEALRLLGYNPAEIIDIKSSDIAGYPKGEPLTVKSIYPTGGLLQDKTTGGVYYVQDGTKKPIWSKNLMNLYFSDYKITAVSPDELAQYQTLDPVKLKDGELVRSVSDPTVYFISNSLKLPILSEKIFESMGYKWENVITIEDKILNLHPSGSPIALEI